MEAAADTADQPVSGSLTSDLWPAEAPSPL